MKIHNKFYKITSLLLLIAFTFTQLSYANISSFKNYDTLATNHELHGPQRAETLEVEDAVALIGTILSQIEIDVDGAENQASAKTAMIDLRRGLISPDEARQKLASLGVNYGLAEAWIRVASGALAMATQPKPAPRETLTTLIRQLKDAQKPSVTPNDRRKLVKKSYPTWGSDLREILEKLKLLTDPEVRSLLPDPEGHTALRDAINGTISDFSLGPDLINRYLRNMQRIAELALRNLGEEPESAPAIGHLAENQSTYLMDTIGRMVKNAVVAKQALDPLTTIEVVTSMLPDDAASIRTAFDMLTDKLLEKKTGESLTDEELTEILENEELALNDTEKLVLTKVVFPNEGSGPHVRARVDDTYLPESQEILARLSNEIAARRADLDKMNDLEKAQWLFDWMDANKNCREELFVRNMPPHLRFMPDIIRDLNPRVPPALLIAASFHDIQRFFEGFYTHVADEPPVGSEAFLDYKAHQHSEEAAIFVTKWLREVGVSPEVLHDVGIFVLHHETGITEQLARERGYPLELVSDMNLLQRADAISQFIPQLLITSVVGVEREQGEGKGIEVIRYKYGRLMPEDREGVNRTIERGRDVFQQTEEGRIVYDAFQAIRQTYYAQAAEPSITTQDELERLAREKFEARFQGDIERAARVESDTLTILVTGAAGFIGSNFVDHILTPENQRRLLEKYGKKSLRVVVVDSLTLDGTPTGSRENLPQGYAEHGNATENDHVIFCRADIRDNESISKIFGEYRPNIVVNFAAQVSVPVSERDPQLDYEINIDGLSNILENCVRFGADKFIPISSAAVFGMTTQQDLPLKENAPMRPFSNYGRNKAQGETITRLVHEKFGLPYTVLRFANVYGPRQSVKLGEAAVIPAFLDRMLKGRQPTVIAAAEEGALNPQGGLRDYVFVGDVAEAATLACLGNGNNQAFNIGTGHGTRTAELVDLINELTGENITPQPGAPREGDIAVSLFDPAGAKEGLGFEAKVPLQDGLRQTIDFYRSHIAREYANSVPVPFSQTSHDASELEQVLNEAITNIDNLNQASPAARAAVREIMDIYENNTRDFVLMQLERRLDTVKKFKEHYGDGAVSLARAPGRVNLIGEHTDNQDGFVFPVAIDKDIIIAFRPTNDGTVTLHSTDENQYANGQAGVDLTPFNANDVPFVTKTEFGADVEKAPDTLRIGQAGIGDPAGQEVEIYGKTFTYIIGSAKGLRRFANRPLKGVQMLIEGRSDYGGIPQKAGVSSSSALTVASAIALASANDIAIGPVQLSELTCDWERYQTGGGMMDQFASINGQKGRSIFLDCRRVENAETPEDAFGFETLPLPAGYKLVAMNTKEESAQVTSEYNERRSCVEIGTRWLIYFFSKQHPQTIGKIKRMRDITPENLGITEAQINEILNLLPLKTTKKQILESEYGQTDQEFLDKIFSERQTKRRYYRIRQRCRYQTAENARVLAARQALIDGDIEAFARAINEGQTNKTDGGAQNGIQNSSPGLNAITKIALKSGAISARLSGKGWGGVAVAIIPPNVNTDEFIERVRAGYERRRGISLEKGKDIFVCSTSRGAGVENYNTTTERPFLPLERAVADSETAAGRILDLSRDWQSWQTYEQEVLGLARAIRQPRKIQPVIPAAGSSTRWKESQGQGSKNLALVDGKPSLGLILDNLKYVQELDPTVEIEKPIIVLGAEGTEESQQIEEYLKEAGYYDNVVIVRQSNPIGTGNAVYTAFDQVPGLQNFDGDVLVMWGKMAVSRPETILNSIWLHQGLRSTTTGANVAMTIPTTIKENPYAYLSIDETTGDATDILETHLEGAVKIEQGQDNVGVFLASGRELYRALNEVHEQYYDPGQDKYPQLAKGEFGFPNCMVPKLTQDGLRVRAYPTAHPYEALGISYLDDAKTAAGYRRGLEAQKPGTYPSSTKHAIATQPIQAAQREQWARSFVDSVHAEVAKLEEGQRLGIVLDTSITNLRDYAPALIRELEAMAEKEGFKDKLDIIAGEEPALLIQVYDYLGRNKNAIVRGVIKYGNIQNYNSRFHRAELSERISLVAVNDANVQNTDSANLHYIPILPIIASSLTGELRPIPYINKEDGEGIVTSILTILPPAAPVLQDSLEELYNEDSEFLSNA